MGCKWAPDFESVHQSNFKKKIYEQQASFLWSDFDNAFWIRHLVIIKIRRLLNEPDTKERKQRKLCNPLRLFSQVKIRKRGERAKWAMWGTCEHGRKQEISRERQKRMRTQHRESESVASPFQVRSLGAEHATEEECHSLWQKKEMVEGGKQGIRGGVQGWVATLWASLFSCC